MGQDVIFDELLDRMRNRGAITTLIELYLCESNDDLIEFKSTKASVLICCHGFKLDICCYEDSINVRHF